MRLRRYEVFLLHHFTSNDSGAQVQERRPVGRYFSRAAALSRCRRIRAHECVGSGFTTVHLIDHRTAITEVVNVL